MEKSLNGDSRKLSRLSTGPITPFAEEISEKRSRFKQKAQFVNHHTQQNTQLPEVYANCIKMCNENKITVQNAFGLDLIDYMAEMVHNDDSEMTNFQVASCTLDASAKIYAHRVDHVHAETFKIAGNLGRNEKDASIVGEKSHDSSINSAPKKKKVWKGRRIASNLDTITLSKITEATDVDPLSKQMTEIFSEGYSGGYLLTTLSPYDDSGELMIDYNVPYYHDKKELCSSARGKVDVSLLRDLVTAAFLEKDICPQFDSLQFNGVEPLQTEDMQLDIDVTNDQMPFDNVDQDDVNGNQMGFEDDDDHNVDADNQMSNNLSGSGENAINTVAGFQRAEFIDALSNAPSEYSYFTANFISTWAGPNHWKIKAVPKDRTTDAKVTKPRKANQQKELKAIDLEEELNFDGKFESVKSQLTVRVLNAWRKLKTTLPVERHYKIKELAACYLAPHMMKMLKANFENSGQSGGTFGETSSTSNDYPAGIEHADSSGVSEDLFGRMDNAETQCTPFDNADTQTEIFGGDNLIKAPHMVAKLDINYCKTAKRINFKKLKCSLWKLITKSEQDDFNETLQSLQDINISTVMFNDLYRALSSCLPQKMVENMSIPIAISCLLHLANERNLELVPENETDIIIRQG